MYLTRSPSQTIKDDWRVTTLDVGWWRGLSVGDRIVALDRDLPDEFLLEVAEVELTLSEVFYWLRHLVYLDPLSSPGSTARAPGDRRTTEMTD